MEESNKIIDQEPVRKHLREYTDDDLQWYLDNNEKAVMTRLGPICSEILRRKSKKHLQIVQNIDRYYLDELIMILESIRDNKEIMLNIPKALYSLALEIEKIKQSSLAEVLISSD